VVFRSWKSHIVRDTAAIAFGSFQYVVVGYVNMSILIMKICYWLGDDRIETVSHKVVTSQEWLRFIYSWMCF
jgi:hypothetical protein